MTLRQLVIEVGDWSIKAGLWEQSFLPTLIIPSFGNIVESKWKEGNFYDTCSPSSPSYINPIISGDINHLEILFRHLFSRLLSTDSSTVSPSSISPPFKDILIFFIIPGDWNLERVAIMTSLFYDRLQVNGVYWIGESLSASFSIGTLYNAALVINIGHSKTNIAVINDNQICRHLKETVWRGGRDFDQYIYDHQHLLKEKKQETITRGEKEENEIDSILVPDASSSISSSNSNSISTNFIINLDEARMIKEQALSNGKSSFTIRERELDLSRIIENESQMYDRLLDDENDVDIEMTMKESQQDQSQNQDQSKDQDQRTIRKQAGILTAIYSLISRFDVSERKPTLLENVIITGPTTILPGLRSRFLERIKSSSTPSLVCKSEFYGEFQIKQVRLKTIPEYFSNKIKVSTPGQKEDDEKGEKDEVFLWEKAAPWMTWFGGGIGAKAALHDTRTMTTREEWQEHSKQILYNIRF